MQKRQEIEITKLSQNNPFLWQCMQGILLKYV